LLPFSVQTGRAVIQQVGGELEESARITGASFARRLAQITVPLAIRGLAAGGLVCVARSESSDSVGFRGEASRQRIK
jgi:ABC-type Fe3+ transport system permease subunit